MWFTPAATAARSTSSASSPSPPGGPKKPSPASCIAPYPTRCTWRGPSRTSLRALHHPCRLRVGIGVEELAVGGRGPPALLVGAQRGSDLLAASSWSGANASTNTSRTARRWGTVAPRNALAPVVVRTTSAPRLSVAHSSRRMRPRRSIRPRWWDRRLRSHVISAASSEERRRCPGASLRASRTE